MAELIEKIPKNSLPVKGKSKLFEVNQIFCVGRNYAEHALEMGHDPDREAPFFFLKPSFSLLSEGGEMAYPPASAKLQHEVELVVALGEGAEIMAYGVGLDMTRRDLQAEAKSAGRPWDSGKAFLHSAPCSALVLKEEVLELKDLSILLEVNGKIRQKAKLDNMIWKIPELITELKLLFPLSAGDLIFTGTPAGVSDLEIGDKLNAKIDRIGELNLSIGKALGDATANER